MPDENNLDEIRPGELVWDGKTCALVPWIIYWPIRQLRPDHRGNDELVPVAVQIRSILPDEDTYLEIDPYDHELVELGNPTAVRVSREKGISEADVRGDRCQSWPSYDGGYMEVVDDHAKETSPKKLATKPYWIDEGTPNRSLAMLPLVTYYIVAEDNDLWTLKIKICGHRQFDAAKNTGIQDTWDYVEHHAGQIVQEFMKDRS